MAALVAGIFCWLLIGIIGFALFKARHSAMLSVLSANEWRWVLLASFVVTMALAVAASL